MEGQVDGYKMHRSTSIRLRKRRDQARKEFLNERKSGEFRYSSHHDGWSYVSFQSPENGTQPNRPGPVSLGLNSVRCHPQHPIIGGARSLGFIPSVDDDDQPSSYYPPVHIAVPGQTPRQVMSDTEDCARVRRRGGRGGRREEAVEKISNRHRSNHGRWWQFHINRFFSIKVFGEKSRKGFL